MTIKTLSKPALDTISGYMQLPFPDRQVSCPYFNNKRSKVRAGLRVLLGKGNIQEIVDEALLFGLREGVNVSSLDNETLKKFLVDHNIGIDCSAFAYYVLEAELRSTRKISLSKKLFYPHAKNFIRKALTKLRPVENINVLALSHEKNSQVVASENVQPGDMIILLNAGKEHNLNHVLLVYKVEYENTTPKILSYTHSFAWSTDGKYHHGIKMGTITLTEKNTSLLKQKWEEAGKQNDQNETYLRAKEAETLEIRRLRS